MHNTHTLPAGTYYVGDLCYSVDNDDWPIICDEIDHKGTPFEYRGKLAASSYTRYGDGGYDDSEGRFYGVDSGSIGIAPVEVLADPHHHGGQVITFKKPFDIHFENGVFKIDDFVIHTGDTDDYDYED
jgi:hypothetical protein